MTLNIHIPSSLVKFYSLKPGDVFRYEINKVSHYFMKTKQDESCSSNCVDLTDCIIGRMLENESVYEVQSAELNITN